MGEGAEMTGYLRILLPANRRRGRRRGDSVRNALRRTRARSLTALLVTTAPPARAAPCRPLPGVGRVQRADNPTVVSFASDGRVFVAEKRGVIKVFDSLTDTPRPPSPT